MGVPVVVGLDGIGRDGARPTGLRVGKWMLGFFLALRARGAGEEVRGVENGHQNLRLRLGLGAGDTAGREDSISAMEGRSEAISAGRLSLIRYSDTPTGCRVDSSAHLTIVLSLVLQPVFTSDEHKALPEFEKESFDIRQERVLELLFAVAGRQGDEVEGVGVLRDFLRQVAFAFRKTGREIRERLAMPLVQFRVEEVQKNRTAPAVGHGLPDIEKRGFRIRPELVDDGDVVSPRNGED